MVLYSVSYLYRVEIYQGGWVKMPKKTNLPSETKMYSINPSNGEVLVHHLPWAEDSPQLQKYIKRGFTYERPEGITQVTGFFCECGKECSSKAGLKAHERSHK